MESSYSPYLFSASRDRLDEILEASDAAYEEVDSVPSRDRLTFTNGFYVNCTAVFVDIRGSTELAQKYKRPTLAKIYRAYISESVAVLKDHTKTREVSIHGDAVWAVYDTPYKRDIEEGLAVAAECCSLVDVLNHKLKKRSLNGITVGVGASWGRALMIKAGFKSSGINDVVWMGDVVNEAAHLASYGNRTWSDRRVMISGNFYGNLSDESKEFFEYNASRGCYHGNVVSIPMNSWLDGQP